jgi:catechol 2,3-dioxygenase-like lactoylglutathione lyase family enzyme
LVYDFVRLICDDGKERYLGFTNSAMNRRLVHISILVDDYDEAIDFYTHKLDFELVADQQLSETKRWVLVKPKGQGDCSLLLAKADGEKQKSFVGDQTGGRVFLFLNTDNFERDFANLKKHNVKIVRGPVSEVYGKVAVFEDLYGNKWDLIEPA